MPRYIGSFKSRKTIAAFLLSGEGLIAGMWVSTPEGPILRDSTGELPLTPQLLPEPPGSAPAWLALNIQNGQAQIVYHQPLIEDQTLTQALDRHRQQRRRLEIVAGIRAFFIDQGFLEVDSPIAVVNPGNEPYLDTFPIGDLWLRTSPELHMKRLLGQGFDNIFQMGACFRKGDIGKWHREEFCMLEWYRSFADLEAIADDLANLLAHLSPLASDSDYFNQAPERVTCVQLFQRYLDLTLTDCTDCKPLREALAKRGIETEDGDDWDTLYFLLFLNFIEPHLGKDRPVIVSDYPASQAALAKLAPITEGEMPTCYRLELYLRGGLELANAFYELTDADEQRKRFQEDSRHRKQMNKPVYRADEAFLATLDRGLPPCAGIALGVDRLVAALLGTENLDVAMPFPVHEKH